MKKEKAITLIALVITIIILLILAGVAISTLTGENGLLTKANTAKTETIKKSAEEKVKIAVAGSFGENGEIDLEDLNTNLRQVEGLTDILYNDASIMNSNKIEKLPIDVVVDGYLIEINEMGKVSLKAIKPVVNYELSTENAVTEGTEVTVTITATTTEGTIVQITKPDGTVEKNTDTATFIVTTNGVYSVIVEGSNGEKTTCKVIVANIGTTEIFSDIYTSTQTYTDGKDKTARIPEGFAVGISSTINTIENGLVITDAIDENHKSTGNQFVWVPVENKANFKRVAGFKARARQTGDFSYCSEPFAEGTQEEKDLYDSMYNSVIANKGFYIGRYEAGKENNKVVIKKNMSPYNGVSFNGSTDSNISLEGGVLDLSIGFVNDKSYKDAVSSILCYGVQWDASMQFFDDQYISGAPAANSYVRDGRSKGWYSRNYKLGNPNHLTGVDVDENASNKVKNIYDMGGNMTEMTMEMYGTGTTGSNARIICRGASYAFDSSTVTYGDDCSPSYRYYGTRRWRTSSDEGFHLTLHFTD